MITLEIQCRITDSGDCLISCNQGPEYYVGDDLFGVVLESFLLQGEDQSSFMSSNELWALVGEHGGLHSIIVFIKDLVEGPLEASFDIQNFCFHGPIGQYAVWVMPQGDLAWVGGISVPGLPQLLLSGHRTDYDSCEFIGYATPQGAFAEATEVLKTLGCDFSIPGQKTVWEHLEG